MKWIAFMLLPLIFLPIYSMAAQAASIDDDPTSGEQAAFDEILTPVMSIYRLVKYASAVAGALALAVAGTMYMFSANNVQRREQSKSWFGYIFLGLVVILGTPSMIGLLT